MSERSPRQAGEDDSRTRLMEVSKHWEQTSIGATRNSRSAVDRTRRLTDLLLLLLVPQKLSLRCLGYRIGGRLGALALYRSW